MKDHNDYFDAVTRCMMAFQYIEEALKMILIRLESLIYPRVKDYTPYDLKPKFDSIRNSAMGRLITKLSIYCDDDELINELKRIKNYRNDVAHQSLLMSVEELQDKEITTLKSSDLERLNKEALTILKKITRKWGEMDQTLNEITAEHAASKGEADACP